jgi:hypothetical protein
MIRGIEFSLLTFVGGVGINVFRQSDFENATTGISPDGGEIRFVMPSQQFLVPYSDSED